MKIEKILKIKFQGFYFALLFLFNFIFFRFTLTTTRTHRSQICCKYLAICISFVYLSRLPLVKPRQAIDAKDKNKLHLRAGAHKLSRALGKCGR